MSSANGDTNAKPPASWTDLVAEKQKQCQQKIPEAWRLAPEHLAAFTSFGIDLIDANVCQKSGLLTESELDITENYTAKKLLQRLAAREISALETTTAFCKRAAVAQQVVRWISLVYR
jgi:amidase